MKFSFTKNPESDFIRNPNLTKKIWRVGGDGVGGGQGK